MRRLALAKDPGDLPLDDARQDQGQLVAGVHLTPTAHGR
jgi:hypothetical protein